MRKRLRKKLEKQGRLPEQKPKPWKSSFMGEQSVISRYNHLKSTDPSNPLLESGRIDEQGHFYFTEQFYQRNTHIPRPEDYHSGHRLGKSRAAIKYLLELKDKLKKQGASFPQFFPLEVAI